MSEPSTSLAFSMSEADPGRTESNYRSRESDPPKAKKLGRPAKKLRQWEAESKVTSKGG